MLLGSGGSSFSAWASFLSRAVTITHTGQSLQWFKLDGSGDQCVTEFDPRVEIASALADRIRGALSEPRG